jgi:hypothetical protein
MAELNLNISDLRWKGKRIWTLSHDERAKMLEAFFRVMDGETINDLTAPR